MERPQPRELCQTMLRELDLQPPLNIDLLVARLAAQRGKAIDVVPTDLPPNQAYGLTGGDETCDVILVQARTSLWHQRLIILHEIVHLWCQHPRTRIDHSYGRDPADDFHAISPAMLAAVFGDRRVATDQPGTPQTCYDDPYEWEAEMMATILLGWVGADDAPGPRLRDPLESLLGDAPAREW